MSISTFAHRQTICFHCCSGNRQTQMLKLPSLPCLKRLAFSRQNLLSGIKILLQIPEPGFQKSIDSLPMINNTKHSLTKQETRSWYQDLNVKCSGFNLTKCSKTSNYGKCFDHDSLQTRSLRYQLNISSNSFECWNRTKSLWSQNFVSWKVPKNEENNWILCNNNHNSSLWWTNL